MRVNFIAISVEPGRLANMAGTIEELGYDALVTAETCYDPFVSLGAAARSCRRIGLGTSIAVAFARNPMTTALLANDLQLLSEGRFSLGLGTQLKAHVTRRFSMPWSSPVTQMREYVLALRAIWSSFATGRRLRFRGETYRHGLLPDFFNPGPNPYGNPPILLGGFGERMTEMVGEVADGFIAHNICSRRYLDEVTLPALRRGREKAGGTLDGFDVHVIPMVATGTDERQLERAVRSTREQLAFYTATPTYSRLLELHGMTEVRDDLHRLSAQGRLDELPAVITDDVLDALAFVGEPREVAAKLRKSFGDVATSVSFYEANVTDPAYWLPLCEALRE